MKHENIQRLSCPACRVPFHLIPVAESNADVLRGLLECPTCRVGTPIVCGFPLFGEVWIGSHHGLERRLQELEDTSFGSRLDYDAFLDRKRTRPAYDLYAAFTPFNEATRSLHPFLSTIEQCAADGDLIVDLWCRTGWTGGFLAGQYPRQHVISVWEGGGNVLGYRGFRYWLENRPPNWDVIFTSPALPLPFADRAAKVVHGLDTLHRYPHRPLISECLRITEPSGLVVFPHVHLTNAEPTPFFERGETKLHGTVYRAHFQSVLADSGRKAFVLSEKHLFETEAPILADDAETEHYNACVVITPAGLEGTPLTPIARSLETDAHAYLIPNPLLFVDPATGEARVAPDQLGGGVAELLSRHGIYADRLNRLLPMNLDIDAREALFWADQHLDLSEIAGRMSKSPEELLPLALELEAKELVRVVRVDRSLAVLQDYFRGHDVTSKPSTLTELWERSSRLHAERPFIHWLEDGSTFTYEDVDALSKKAAEIFVHQGLCEADRILLEAIRHPETIIAFWGAVRAGLQIALVDPEASPLTFDAICQTVRPRLILHVRELAQPGMRLDSDDDGSFRRALEADAPETHLPIARPEVDRVVLFTSGSTGRPKAVVSSDQTLLTSSACFQSTYPQSVDDRLLFTGSLHTMSGLRNVMITPLHAGSSVVLLPGRQTGVLEVLSAASEVGATVLNTSPAFLAACHKLPRKLSMFASTPLRRALVTAAPLDPNHARTFSQALGCPVANYYGLTETSGLCTATPPSEAPIGIGKPVAAVVAIRDEQGVVLPVGQTGELTVLTAHETRYLEPYPASSVRYVGRWIYTGDLASVDPDGQVLLLGRKDRMLIDRHGENVHAETIEAVFRHVPEVREAWVLAWPRESSRFAALLVPAAGTSTEAAHPRVLEHLETHLPSHHRPSILRWVDALPLDPTGKLQTRELETLLGPAELGSTP